MQDKFPQIPAENIVPINMNGLRGRMLRLPPKKNQKREILLVYGHRSNLERWYTLAQVMNDYGGVTMPDLPGMGGMDSFYRIGEKPDIDTMADYLASIVKLRYKNRRITLAGISYGFTVVTRMLQRYPDIAKKVDLVFSIAGFAHYEDFRFSKRRFKTYRRMVRIFGTLPLATLFRNLALHPSVLRSVYHRTHNAKHKFEGYDKARQQALTEFEIVLWRQNDIRTWMATVYSMLTLDNCKKQINLPLHHIGVPVDNYFDNDLVEQHMRIIFSDFTYHKANLDRHVPDVLASKKESAPILPASVKRLLKKAS